MGGPAVRGHHATRRRTGGSAAPAGDINLVWQGFYNFSMGDARWSALPVGPDPQVDKRTIGRCGCVLTSLGSFVR